MIISINGIGDNYYTEPGGATHCEWTPDPYHRELITRSVEFLNGSGINGAASVRLEIAPDDYYVYDEDTETYTAAGDCWRPCWVGLTVYPNGNLYFDGTPTKHCDPSVRWESDSLNLSDLDKE